jgi:mRNA interferase HigB
MGAVRCRETSPAHVAMYPFWEQVHSEGVSFETWAVESDCTEDPSPADVSKAYANASIEGPDRVVFDINGNDYRLVVAINYRHRIVFIKWLRTRGDYDKIDVKTVKYGHQAHQRGSRLRQRTRVYEVLQGRRPLSLNMIRICTRNFSSRPRFSSSPRGEDARLVSTEFSETQTDQKSGNRHNCFVHRGLRHSPSEFAHR